MTIERTSAVALDYLPCRYGNSRLSFRGPRRSLGQPYVLFLGGSTTYGKFVRQPFPALLENKLQQNCINLGCMNAGIDSFVNDPDVLNMANSADLTVLEVPGAQNLSNRFYRVHPRRNDRFLGASPLLQAVYSEVDFTEFSFTKHMLGRLQSLSQERFNTVREELRQAWLGRMRLLVSTIRSNVILLWLRSDRAVGPLGPEPLLVTADMINGLRDNVLDLVRVDLTELGQAADMEGMAYGQMEAPAAMHTPGPLSHDRIADRLAAVLAGHM